MAEEPGTRSEPPIDGGEPPELDERGFSRRKFIGSVAAAGIGGLTLAGVLAACGGSSNETTAGTTAAAGTTEAATTTPAGQTAANNGKPILIGSPYPLTGTAATDGQQMKGGSGLAIQQINDRGGVNGRTIEQEIVDTDIFTPEGVTTAFNKLVGMEPDALCIGYVISTPPAYDIVAPYGCPYLNASTSEAQVEITRSDPEKYSMIFQIDPPEIYYGSGIVPFLNNLEASGTWKPSAKTIFILEGDSAYSQAISAAAQDAIQKDGTWQLLGKEPVVTGTTDWGPQISKVQSANPGFVMNTHWVAAELAAFTKQWVQNPTDSLVYLQYGASVPEYIEIAGDAANGMIWATVTGVYNDALGKQFQEQYQKKNGSPAGFSNSGSGYDEVYMLSYAWGVVGDTRNFAGVSSYLKNMWPVRGVNGSYWFSWDSGNVGAPYPDLTPDPSLGQAHLFFQFQDKQNKIIQPAPYIESTFQPAPWMSA